MKKIYSILAGLLLTASVFAQAPQKMSYQAVIRNTNGALVTSTSVGMKISVLQGTATGTVAYSETQTASTNANGLVSIQIGAGTIVTGTFAGINWANGPYFIKTETDPSGGTAYSITGTNQLMSVPYALFSANGTPGPAGATGAQGPIGLTGATGATGTNGTVGATGSQGPIGLTGATGAAGTNGTVGATGSQGPIGLTGATGSQGPIGLTGATGFTGAAGSQGIQGLTGAAGSNGTNGTNGAVGATGPTGPGTICGTATTNYVAKFTGATTMCNSSIFDDGLATGIGTITPSTSYIGAPSVNKLNVHSTTTPANSGMVEMTNSSAVGVAFMAGNTIAANNYNCNEGITWGTNSGLFGLHIPVSNVGYGGSFVTNSNHSNAIGLYCQMPAGSPGWALYVNGDALTSGATWYLSDRKLKTNIQPIESPIKKLMKINGFTYNFSPEFASKYGLAQGTSYGVIADEVAAVFPEMIKDARLVAKTEGKPNQPLKLETLDAKSVNYIGLIPVLIEAIKEQQKQIEDLKKQVEILEKK